MGRFFFEFASKQAFALAHKKAVHNVNGFFVPKIASEF